MKLETLCLINWNFSFPARWPMFAVLPVIKLSMAMTRCPSARSRYTRCDPRKPAPPVTTETGWELLAIGHLFSDRRGTLPAGSQGNKKFSMTKEMTKLAISLKAIFFYHSDFAIDSSFDIRHSSFT